jgi:CO/xanthine dehydrogenase Mo-binding subunit
MNMTTAPLIGQPVDRAEDRRFLTGAGMFVDDLKREGMLHAVILRSSVAHDASTASMLRPRGRGKACGRCSPRPRSGRAFR